jgi:hypothetical protein
MIAGAMVGGVQYKSRVARGRVLAARLAEPDDAKGAEHRDLAATLGVGLLAQAARKPGRGAPRNAYSRRCSSSARLRVISAKAAIPCAVNAYGE